MFFNSIKPEILFQCERLHLNLSHLYEIELSYYYPDVNRGIPEALTATLERKNLMTKDGHLTSEGKVFYECLSDPNFFINSANDLKKEMKAAKGESDSRWKEWIALYPKTASWITPYGTELTSTRRLRQDTVGNEKKYLAILAKGGIYTQEHMCNVLKYQLELIKKESIRLRTNKMEFMQGTEPYLNQATYDNFMDEMLNKNWTPDPTLTTEVKQSQSLDTFAL